MRRLFAAKPSVVWALPIVLIVLTAGYFGFHALFVKVGRSVEQPFSGPARYNRYYVLQRYLEERGLKVQSVRDWPQPLSHDTLVLWFATDAVPRDVRRWMAAGGRLWSFRDPDARSRLRAWEATPWKLRTANDTGVPVTDAGQAADDSSAEEATLPAAEEEGAAAADGQVAQQSADAEQAASAAEPAADDDYDEDWCAEGCLTAAQFQYGAGCLTLVRSFGLENEQVFLGETPARIDALLRCLRRPASVLLVTSAGSPWFGQLLVEHASEATVAFAVLLVLALWRAGKHLGPKLPPRRRERRQMLEHISAVGTLAGRVGLSSMLAAARRELCKRLIKRVPQAASLGGEALVRAVAQATEVPASEVQRALIDEPSGDSQAALAIARAMQALWRKT